MTSSKQQHFLQNITFSVCKIRMSIKIVFQFSLRVVRIQYLYLMQNPVQSYFAYMLKGRRLIFFSKSQKRTSNSQSRIMPNILFPANQRIRLSPPLQIRDSKKMNKLFIFKILNIQNILNNGSCWIIMYNSS